MLHGVNQGVRQVVEEGKKFPETDLRKLEWPFLFLSYLNIVYSSSDALDVKIDICSSFGDCMAIHDQTVRNK